VKTSQLKLLNRTAAAVLAAVIKKHFPSAVLSGGGLTQIGFSYSFYLEEDQKLSPVGFLQEQMEMYRLNDYPISFKEMVLSSLTGYLKHHNMSDRLEFLELSKQVLYPVVEVDGFVDVMEGPFLKKTNDLRFFKLLDVARSAGGLYTIEGIACNSKSELKEFLKKYKRYQTCNHMAIGLEKGFFDIADGEIVFLKKGLELKNRLSKFWKKSLIKNDFTIVETSNDFEDQLKNKEINHKKLFEKSNEFFKKCAEQVTVVQKDLTGQDLFSIPTCNYFFESAFMLDEEVECFCNSSLQFIEKTLTILGFTYRIVLCQSAKKHLSKVEKSLKSFCENQLDYEIVRGEKLALQFQLQDELGRWHKGPYLSFTKKGKMVEVARSSLGKLETAFALLLEKHQGKVPMILSEEKLRIIPLKNEFEAYAKSVAAIFWKQGIEATIHLKKEELKKELFLAGMDEVSFVAVVGAKELQKKTVCLRNLLTDEEQTLSLEQLENNLKLESYFENK